MLLTCSNKSHDNEAEDRIGYEYETIIKEKIIGRIKSGDNNMEKEIKLSMKGRVKKP
jgi:hypothetical protein